MGTTRYVLRRSSRAKLTLSQMEEMWLGPSDNGSSFQSDEHRRSMWVNHREKIMRLWGKNGKRPYAWWRYESPFRSGRHPGPEHEKSILYEFTDALSVEERAELEAYWRREFELSWRPNFSYCKEGRIFTGDIARELHWLWADIPPPYLDKLMAERERRGRVIHTLEGESPPVQQETATEGSA